MIGPGYCQTMARYNAWQNRQLEQMLSVFSADDLAADKGAFFGSILGTLNHILWGDRMWMSRFAGWEKPAQPGSASTEICPTIAVWSAERFRTDAKLILWADKLNAIDLAGDLVWVSGMTGQELRKPRAQCLAHMFNHQTHHRGQVHAMITASGHPAPVSDLAFLPDDL